MKCLDIEKIIEDYSYGELNPQLAREVETHLASCGHCSRLLESLRMENKTYENYGKALDRSLEVSPAMWGRIPGEAAARRSGKHFWTHLLPRLLPGRRILFASLLLLVSAAVTLLVVHHTRGSRPDGAAAVESFGGTDLNDALLSIKKAEQEYVQAIRVLSGIVEKRKNALDPALAADLDSKLKAIDELIVSTQNAYHAHPADPELAQYMLAAYQKKVELLQDLALTIS